jgi:TATA-box binding protein (TBP) (component of TFIID and TFIIIB)
MEFDKAVVKNVKISVHLERERETLANIANLSKESDVGKRNDSFFVLRRHGFVYTIFVTGHVNVTKIKCLEDVPTAVARICGDLNARSAPRYTVDNITACGRVHLPARVLRLKTLCDYVSVHLTELEILTVSFDTQKFPGCFLKTLRGTILLFNSGKFVFVGVRALPEIAKLEETLRRVVWRAITLGETA